MKRINHKKDLSISIVLLLILVIGIGYAYLTSNLSITGATEVVANTWNIHFENLNVKDGSVTATNPATIQGNNVDITYSISLARPKDYYEFTVDVKNDGTLPGKVSISTINGITNEASSVIDYTITYINGNSVNIGDILNAGAKKTIKVRVFYKDDITSEDFPSNNLNLTLTFNLQYVQSEEDEFDTNALINKLKTENSSCFTKYTGNVTDRVGVTEAATNVYFNKCSGERNIIFGGYCWQMIRTTETGGIKMIYNGEPDNNGGCGSSRPNHKGVIQTDYDDQNLSSSYLYGSSFTYDTSTNEFTLVDTTTETWSDSTYENLVGKYTCKTTSNKCTTIYNVNGYKSNTEAYASSYTIGDTNYAQIGKSSYNANYKSPAMVGYMFNKVYNQQFGNYTSGSLVGNDVSYSNGTYTLLPASGESSLGTTMDASHHYTCNTTSSTCSKVRYYFYSTYYYIELDGEENIEEAVNNMLYSDNVNRYNSSIKGITDAWYAQNLSSKTSMLEDTIFCNARNMNNQGTNGWDKNGAINTYIYFKNTIQSLDLSCLNETDQFSVGNNKAKLTYPVGMINHEEWQNVYSSSLIVTGDYFRSISPFYFNWDHASVRYVNTGGGLNNDGYVDVQNAQGSRPAFSLKEGTVIVSGHGSTTDPWIISE